ncbi:MAG: hypothetical protein OPY07_04470 [Nitrosopumilus sp.]|nr:hypothetical protein [Nitrosopumilus sp.]
MRNYPNPINELKNTRVSSKKRKNLKKSTLKIRKRERDTPITHQIEE